MTTSIREVRLAIDNAINEHLLLLKEWLVSLGDICLAEAYVSQEYMNQLGNLSGSTGYICVDNGVEYAIGGFREPEVTNFKQGSVHPSYLANHKPGEGVIIGPQYALSLISNYSKGYAMIFVAGMEYAGYVEAKGKNVITKSELVAQQEAKKLISQFKFR